MDNQVEQQPLDLEASADDRTISSNVFEVNTQVDVPKYLDETYWWAYLHPKGVVFFDKPFIVNAILFGNYKRLRDSVVADISQSKGNVLQLAAVYGNISVRIAEALNNEYLLDVVDVAAIQLQNLSKKITHLDNVNLYHQDASKLDLVDEYYEHVVSFFLLHEVPDELKTKILKQAIDKCKPGGTLTIVDYHKPVAYSPQRYLMYLVLNWLEPFALSMWRDDVQKWLPETDRIKSINKTTFFGGLYQKVTIKL